MGWAEKLLEDAEEQHLEETTTAIEETSPLGEGKEAAAYLLRGRVVKPVEYKPMKYDHKKEVEKTQEIDRFPFTYVEVHDLQDIGLWQQTALIRQEKSDLNYEQALNELQTDQVIEETVNMFDDLIDQGITYDDAKPENINFFKQEESYNAKPIDVLDKAAYTEYEPGQEELFENSIKNMLQLYTEGSVVADGLNEISEYDSEEIEQQVIENSNYLETEEDSYDTAIKTNELF